MTTHYVGAGTRQARGQVPDPDGAASTSRASDGSATVATHARGSRLGGWRHRWLPLLVFTIPAIILYGWFFAAAVGETVFYSFFQWNAITDPVFIGIQNFVDLVQDPVFVRALVNTAYMTALLLFVQLPVALLLAWFLYRKVRGHGFLRTIYFIPVVISSVAVALLFSFLYETNFGLINSALRSFGLGGFARNWLGDEATAMTAVTLPLIWTHYGLMMIILLAAMQGLSKEVLEAAEVDGVNARQRLWHVVLPMIRGAIGVCIILSLTTALKVFDFVLLLTQGGPANLTQVTGSYLYEQGYQQFRYGYGSAIATTIMFIVALAFLLPMFFRARKESR